MQKTLLIRALPLLCLICFMLSFSVFAKSKDFESAATQYKDGYTGEEAQTESAVEKQKEVLSALDVSAVWDLIISCVSDSSRSLIKSFGCIIAVIFISSVFSVLKDSFGASSHIFDKVGMLFLIVFTLIPMGQGIEAISGNVRRLCAFMLSFIPSMTALYVSGGNTSAAVSSAITCSAYVGFLQILSERVIIPFAKVSIFLCALGGLCKKVNLSGITAFLKTTGFWITGLCLTIFSGLLSVQTLITGSADSLALRGVRFSASKLIPVAGGMVSESLKTVLSGVAFVKSVAGGAGIVFILYTVIPPVASVLILKLFCLASSMCAKLSGLSDQSSYLDGLNTALNLLLAVILSACTAFIICLAIFMKTAVNI